MDARRAVWVLGMAFVGVAGCSDRNGDAGGDANGDGNGGAAAGDTGGSGNAGAGNGGSGAGDQGAAPVCTPTQVTCAKQAIAELDLQAAPGKGTVTNEPNSSGWTSHIDATGGGLTATPSSYIYTRFSADGLTKVSISDLDSLTWADWEIAFHPQGVRINSGDSGPSCVQAAAMPVATVYEEVGSAPEGIGYRRDDYFTDKCGFVPYAQGMNGSPATALSSSWTYQGCVKTSGRVFVLELASGRHVKLVVDDYYSPDVQAQCNAMESGGVSNASAGSFTVRWAFLD